MNRFVACLVLAVAACGGSRSTFVRYPGAPAAFDPTASDPKAVAIAQKVFAAAGGPGHWDSAKQLRWRQTVTADGQVKLDGEEAWDRWNARHWGKLHRDDGDVVVGYDLYGTFAMAYVERGKHEALLDQDSKQHALEVARSHFDVDTATLALQFLMLEPGAKLAYVGPAADDTGADAADDISVTFADPLRHDFEFHAIVDRATSLIQRIEMTKVGTDQKIGYALSAWVTVNGMKFATARKDLGSTDTIAIADLAVGDPDDELFIAPLAQ